MAIMKKFTKEDAFKYLNALATEIEFKDDLNKNKFLAEIKENFEPQRGGGASKHPSYKNEETGEMMHYCRFVQAHIPESEIVMSGGKSKGAGKRASKHNYELGKEVAELKDKALDFFKLQDWDNGGKTQQEADKIEKSRTNPATYDIELMSALYTVDGKFVDTNKETKEVKVEKTEKQEANDTAMKAGTNEVVETEDELEDEL